jgi:hypothetical protein
MRSLKLTVLDDLAHDLVEVIRLLLLVLDLDVLDLPDESLPAAENEEEMQRVESVGHSGMVWR